VTRLLAFWLENSDLVNKKFTLYWNRSVPPLQTDVKDDKILKITSENNSMQANVWMYLFFSLLVIAVVIVAYQDMRTADQPLIYYKEKYEDLERSYIELAKSHSYVLETIMKNNVDMQPYWPEFADKSKDDYVEYLRRRIIAMQVEIERLDRDHKP
jgi:hypothetical protein